MKAFRYLCITGTSLLIGLSGSSFGATIVRSGSGSSPADIQAVVDLFRADVSLGGGVNPPGSGPFATGRRQIGWDGVPDSRSEPNFMPEDQFIRAGALFDTPGTGFFVSADDSNPTSTPPLFEALNPAYAGQFQAFSQQRLFIAVDSVITDTRFFLPSDTGLRASVNGFGAVFSDVDLPGSTLMEYFDIDGISLGSFEVPTSPDGGLSFLGVFFADGERVAKVRITSGNLALGGSAVDGPNADVVVMDDFIYGEPQVVAVPEASTWAAAAMLGLLASGAVYRRRVSNNKVQTA